MEKAAAKSSACVCCHLCTSGSGAFYLPSDQTPPNTTSMEIIHPRANFGALQDGPPGLGCSASLFFIWLAALICPLSP